MFTEKTTDTSYWDKRLKDPDRYGVKIKIEYMSPTEYMEEVTDMFREASIEEYPEQMKDREFTILDTFLGMGRGDGICKIVDDMRKGDVFPMLVLDYDLMQQEGRHRAMASHILQNYSIPVLIVEPA